VEISLGIPDNEARTALATLQRLDVAAAALERADLYRCEVEEAFAEALPDALRAAETIFNPNKHRLRVRAGDAPLPGEVWIDERGRSVDTGPVRVSGRILDGVRSLERFTAWRLFDAGGGPVAREVLEAAIDRLLCNPAYQKATR
jgi:hypothetical protein